MRHLAIFSICACIAIVFWAGCKKDQNVKVSKAIIGSWELRKTTAAMNPNDKIYPEGNGNIYKFSGDRYEKFQNGTIEKTGTYQIEEDATVSQSVCLEFPAGQYSHRIVFDNDNTNSKTFLQIVNNNLVFISGCYAVDAGHTAEYKKQ